MNVSLKEFINNYLPKSYNENMFLPNGKINPKYNTFKKTGIIAKIFEEHWKDVYLKNKTLIDEMRPNADYEINKIIDCANKSLGCSAYECPNCKDIIFIGYTCKSRICSSCGYKYKLNKVENIMQTAYKVQHRQIVFTIPKELRKYFFHPFKQRIDLLFKAVNETIYSILNLYFKSDGYGHIKKHIRKNRFIPGFFAFLHTFGRDIKWNPHIHILIAEMKLSNNKIQDWSYFNYDALSKRFMKILLDLLYEDIGKSFYKVKCDMYKKYPNGFYVYAEKKKFKNIKSCIEYVTRYCGRVPISENRIINYDGNNVTFCYNAHEDESYHEETVTAEKFILMLLRHLIPSNYKIIRYYGFYRKKHKLHDKIELIIDVSSRRIRTNSLRYENSIKQHFNRNPYNCPICDVRCKFLCEIV